MVMQIEQHRLIEALQVNSPNQSERPSTAIINLLVIHNISLPPGEFGTGYVRQLFCNELDCSIHPDFAGLTGLKVSSHLLIERNGGLIQFVAFDQKAWHAGISEFCGIKDCNDFSIGIELEGTDSETFTDEQYKSLKDSTRVLIKHYPGLHAGRIVGHSDIAPGRKTDPGPCFDWQRYLDAL